MTINCPWEAHCQNAYEYHPCMAQAFVKISSNNFPPPFHALSPLPCPPPPRLLLLLLFPCTHVFTVLCYYDDAP